MAQWEPLPPGAFHPCCFFQPEIKPPCSSTSLGDSIPGFSLLFFLFFYFLWTEAVLKLVPRPSAASHTAQAWAHSPDPATLLLEICFSNLHSTYRLLQYPLVLLQINQQTQKHLKSPRSPPTSTPRAHAVLGGAHPRLAQPAAPQPDYKRLRNDITVNLAQKPADFVQNAEQLIVTGGGAGRKGGADGIKLGTVAGGTHPGTAQPLSKARLHLLPPAAGFKGTSSRLTWPLGVIARVGFH